MPGCTIHIGRVHTIQFSSPSWSLAVRVVGSDSYSCVLLTREVGYRMIQCRVNLPNRSTQFAPPALKDWPLFYQLAGE